MYVKKIYWFSVLAGCFLINSCVVPPSKPTSIIDMHNGLRKDLAADQVIAASPHQNVAMNTALLASKSLQPISNEDVEHRFDISVNNASAKSFFLGLVSGTPYNMVVSPDITGTVSLKLKNVTVEEALQAVEDIYGYSYQRTSYGFEVLPPSLQTQLFNVNYLDVDRTGHSDVSLSSTELSESIGTTNSGGTSNGSTTPSTGGDESTQLASGAHVTTTSKSNFWPSLQNTLTEMIGTSDGRSVQVNPQAGIIVVRGYPQDLREIAQYLDKTQLSLNRQVVLEAKILEVQLNDNYQAGIDWKALRASQSIAGVADPITNSIFTLGLGGEDTDFSGTIKLLEEQGNVQVLSSPRISTVNNQQAVIKVGTDDFFVTSVTSNVVPTGGSTTNSSSVGLTPFFSGITLDVTPEIGTDKEVVLHIHPSVSTVIDKEKKVDLGSSGTLKLPLAESTVRESDSVVHARDGQVIVIGGLMQNSTSENLNSTPGISRIPFLGTLFRQTKQASAKSELVILLRPTVVNDNTWSQQIQGARTRYCDLDRGFHVGSRPEVFGTQGEIDY
jgi:MSHA biogenesis protein MshL